MYAKVAAPVDPSDLQPHNRKHAFSCECIGTLESGEQWGCGKDFGTEEDLFKHWQDETGIQCRQGLNDEVEVKIKRWQGADASTSVTPEHLTPLWSVMSTKKRAVLPPQGESSEVGNDKQTPEQPSKSNDTDDVEMLPSPDRLFNYAE